MEKLKVALLKFPSLPVKDTLIIKSLSEFSSKIYCTIMDLSGKEIITNMILDIYDDIIKISVDSLNNGIYLLKLSTDNSFVINSFQVSK